MFTQIKYLCEPTSSRFKYHHQSGSVRFIRAKGFATGEKRTSIFWVWYGHCMHEFAEVIMPVQTYTKTRQLSVCMEDGDICELTNFW